MRGSSSDHSSSGLMVISIASTIKNNFGTRAQDTCELGQTCSGYGAATKFYEIGIPEEGYIATIQDSYIDKDISESHASM